MEMKGRKKEKKERLELKEGLRSSHALLLDAFFACPTRVIFLFSGENPYHSLKHN